MGINCLLLILSLKPSRHKVQIEINTSKKKDIALSHCLEAVNKKQLCKMRQHSEVEMLSCWEYKEDTNQYFGLEGQYDDDKMHFLKRGESYLLTKHFYFIETDGLKM